MLSHLLWKYIFFLNVAISGPPESVSRDNILFPRSLNMELETIEANFYESTKAVLLRYKNMNFNNDFEKIQKQLDYSCASEMLLLMLKDLTKAELNSQIESSTLTMAIEQLIGKYLVDDLDCLVAELIAYSVKKNMDEIWNYFNLDFQEKYINSVVFGLARAGNYFYMNKMLEKSSMMFSCSFVLSLLFSANLSGSLSTIQYAKKHAIQNCNSQKVLQFYIDGMILADNGNIYRNFVEKSNLSIRQQENHLLAAAKVGSIKIVKHLLESILETDPLYHFNESILSETVENSNYMILNYLLRFKPANMILDDHLFKNSYYLQPLFEKSCELGNLDFIDFLLSKDENGTAKFPQIDPLDMNAALIATSKGQLKVIEYLIQIYVDEDEKIDERIAYLTEMAVIDEQFATSDYLEDLKGFEQRITSITEMAIFSRQFAISDYLKDLKGFEMSEYPLSVMNSAFEKEDYQVIEYCLSAFKYGEYIFELMGSSSFSFALKAGHDKIVRHFLNRFPKMNVGYRDNRLLRIAVKRGHVKTVKLLLQKKNDLYVYDGVDPSYRNNQAIRTAVKNSDYKIIKVLLHHLNGKRTHPQISILDHCEKTKLSALDIAILLGKYKVLFILLEKQHHTDRYFHLPNNFKFGPLDHGVTWKSALKLYKIIEDIDQHQSVSYFQLMKPGSELRINIFSMEPFTSLKDFYMYVRLPVACVLLAYALYVVFISKYLY